MRHEVDSGLTHKDVLNNMPPEIQVEFLNEEASFISERQKQYAYALLTSAVLGPTFIINGINNKDGSSVTLGGLIFVVTLASFKLWRQSTNDLLATKRSLEVAQADIKSYNPKTHIQD